MIELKNVSRIFACGNQTTVALDGITLKIPSGKMVAVTGPSGSGKTTLLNILGCIDEPSSGHYYLNRQDVTMFSQRQRARLRNETFGFVVQDFALINDYTIFQNISLPLRYNRAIPVSQKKKDVLAIAERLGIGDKLSTYPPKLSGGQKQRVAIARALINNAAIILADEPTGALDQKNGHEIVSLFREINLNGKTVIIVTHDIGIANQCDEIIELIDGKIKKSTEQLNF
ncbi:MAG: ABC transporter ATP-binding protein [Oscillospiraceae bacterium]|jgi:ABC-type antimicrobial peptide transport system, ATPase component|nr:ABC transporter ATP-binding protein [Oscillospiraceae bacterium]